jgi:hypothetical protein
MDWQPQTKQRRKSAEAIKGERISQCRELTETDNWGVSPPRGARASARFSVTMRTGFWSVLKWYLIRTLKQHKSVTIQKMKVTKI